MNSFLIVQASQGLFQLQCTSVKPNCIITILVLLPHIFCLYFISTYVRSFAEYEKPYIAVNGS